MNHTAPAQGVPRWPSPTMYFQRSTTPNEMWYALGAQNQSAFGTIAASTTALRAATFVISRTVVLDRLAFEVTTGGGVGSVTRVGIYRATSLTNIYPSYLLVDGGEKDTSGTGVMSSSIVLTLSPGFYWYAWQSGTAAATLRAMNPTGQNPISGVVAATLATLHDGVTVNRTYAALPASFPASASGLSGNVPVVGARFSS